MSILIVRGPAGQGARGPVPLPRGLLGQLVASVGEAGHALSVRACGDERELLDALRLAHPSGGYALILDAGAAAGSARLARVLASLQLPCVDVDVRAARTAGFADDAKHGCLARVHAGLHACRVHPARAPGLQRMERERPRRDLTMERHYFADFEAYSGGRPVLWGQVTYSMHAERDEDIDPQALIEALRARAAQAHGIEPGQVRLCHVARL